MAGAIADTTRLGGRVVQEPVTVPGVSFALIADPQGHVVGLAQQLPNQGAARPARLTHLAGGDDRLVAHREAHAVGDEAELVRPVVGPGGRLSIAASATTTRGRRTASVNRPLPSGSLTMVPEAWSTYSVTTTPSVTHTCR